MTKTKKNCDICKQCDCECILIDKNCLYGCDSRLKKICIFDRPELFDMVNNFIIADEGILGVHCFNDLCRCVKIARKEASAYCTENEIIEDEETSIDDYIDSGLTSYLNHLPEKWRRLLTHRAFKSMYAAYLLYYYYETGQAAKNSTKKGDVTIGSNSSQNNSENTEQIEYSTSKNLARTQLTIAQKYAYILKRDCLDKFPNDYCRQKKCDCGKRECDTCGLKATPQRRRPKSVAL